MNTNDYQFLSSIGIVLDEWGVGRLRNHNIRLLESGIFQIGESDKTFDRWANSVELEFDIRSAKGKRQFKRWLEK